MLRGHVADHELMDVLDGTVPPPAAAHLSACSTCRMRVDEARAGLELVRRADVPEPSPLYWEALRRRVAGQLAEEPATVPWWRRVPRPAFGAVLVAAAATLAVVTVVPVDAPTPSVAPVASMSTLPAWSALPEADPDLAVLEGLGSQVADAVPAECRDWAECVATLTDEESQDLAVALRRELGREGAL